ncbi:hypothetical protein L1987_21746 [Smallanthus sonchifolius]|uniref:Uncharacterized protein n=1 Tax=Smallanthus sonchifolius TaxID=185202 RepID=A0ACB9ICY7_9ASTR|nr:hypothetical protein L1987_21746 [Smallanthus sonchifolius]
MEIGKRRLEDDHMSGNWSFGGVNRLCSQGRKISIGVMVDSSAKMKSQNGKGVVVDLQTPENVNSAKDVPTESKHKGKEVVSPDLGTQNKARSEELSPLVHTKPSYQNISYSEATGHQKKVPSFPSTTNVTLEPSGSKKAGEMEPGSYFANQMLNLQAMNANEMKSQNNAHQKEKESSYATPQKELEPKKGITEQGTSERGNSGPVTLKMKLQELLETTYSPNKKQPNSETFKMDANNSKSKSTTNGNGSLHTRKTNFGSLNKIRRPLTRSLTGKKPQAQKSTPKKQTPLFQSKQAQFEENAFSFVETWSKRPTTDADHGFKSFKRKERDIFGTRVQATDGKKTKAAAINVSLFENTKRDSEKVKSHTEMKEKNHHRFGGNNGSVSYNNVDVVTDGKKTKAAAVNVSSFENRTRDSEKFEPNTEMKEKKHHQFGGSNGSGSYNNVDVDSFAKDSLKDNVDPTFELKTAINIPSPISLFQINKEDIDVDTPSENSFRTKRTRSSNSKGFYTKKSFMDLQDSPVIKPDHEENKCFRSPSKVVESGSSESEDDSPITVPVISENFEGNKSCISPYQDEDSESSEDDSPVKGDGDCENFDDSSEQDGFASAVKLFALALERVQSKIHSTTSKQSAAILLSVSKNIQSQLQNAESKIQNEVGKLTNLGKAKRTHPENQYQEQQEQLKHIYEKFKEDVDQHLEKCKNTLEGLEAHQIQVSRMVEKQRLSHKKFLMQTEEVIEKQLNDAQKRLADVHRMAKEKMFKLKYGIAECLKEVEHNANIPLIDCSKVLDTLLHFPRNMFKKTQFCCSSKFSIQAVEFIAMSFCGGGGGGCVAASCDDGEGFA